MKIRPKEVRRTVKLLEDPQPGWMALVDNGANQTPLSVVKRDSIKRKGKETNMARKGKGSKAPNSRLTKMQLSKDKFATKKDVRAYLDENNIEGTGDIEDGDDVWIVKSSEDFSDVKLGKARSTATKHAGVTAFIAPVLSSKEDDPDEDEEEEEESVTKGDSDPDEEEEEEEDGEEGDGDDGDGDETVEEDEREEVEAKGGKRKYPRKAASKVTGINGKKTKVRRAPAPKVEPVLAFVGENAQKYDFWGAYSSSEDNLAGVISDGMSYDNVPPGMEEVMRATFVAIGNIFSDDSSREEKAEKLSQLGSEMAGISLGLFDLFETATEDAQKHVNRGIRKSAQAFIDEMSESIERATDEDFSAFVNVDNGDEDEDEGKPKSKKTAKPKKASDDTPDWAKRLAGRLDNVEKLAKGVTDTLSRSNVSRSMSDSLVDLIDEEDEEADEEEAFKADRLEEVRRSLGLRPNEQKAAA